MKKNILLRSLFVISLLITGSGNSALASPVADLTLVGEGKMRWVFFDLYHIQLYSEDGQYHKDNYPKALAIDYYRAIDRDDLITATVQQWERLKINWNPEWKSQLKTIWPSVNKDDQLILRVDPSGNSHFYLNSTAIGNIADPEFGPAFLAIWLAPETSEPKLRKLLIGKNDP